MPYLIAPQADRHLSLSFLEAQREYVVATGGTDADGLSLAALEERFEGYAQGLAGGAFPWPAVANRVVSTVLWWVEQGPDGPVYLGRACVDQQVAGGNVTVSVRPSRRREGHGTAMLAATLPIAAGRGIAPVILACGEGDEAARRLVESAGAVLEDHAGGVRRYSLQ